MLLLITATISVFALVPNSLYVSLEQIAYDRLVDWSAENNFDERIILIDIDEATLAKVGAWPWSSEQMASLLDALLNHYQVSLIGVDIVFPDQKPNSGKLTALLNHPSVVMSQVLDFSKASNNHTGELITFRHTGLQNVPEIHGFIANHTDFVTVQSKVGHISPIVDADGKVRRIFPVACMQNQCTSMLSLEMYKALNSGLDDEISLSNHLLTLEHYGSGNSTIPLDQENALLIPFNVHPEGYRYISAQSVMQHQIDPAQLNNAVVLLGSTALGLGDYVATPTRNIAPGLELHAQIFSAILDNSFIQPKQSIEWVIIPVLLMGLIFVVLSSRNSKANFMIMIVLLIIIISTQYLLFKLMHWHIPSSPAVLSTLLLGLSTLLHDNFLVNRKLSALALQMGKFIPASLAKRMMRGRDLTPGTEERELTVLVADMRGFTSAAEGISPEKVALLAQKCLETLTQAVYQYGGNIEKFSGDGLMAIWGAPQPDADHANHAFLAGQLMQIKIHQLAPWFKQHGFKPMQVSIGINTGKMAFGVFGGDSHLAWSAHGDAVNVASRIEQLTRQVGKPMLVGKTTAELVGIHLFQDCGEYIVKGRQVAVRVYSPIVN